MATRTPAELAEFNAKVAQLRAAREADKTPALGTSRDHAARWNERGVVLYYGRGATATERGIEVWVTTPRGRTVLRDPATHAEIASFGSPTRFWAGRA